MAGPKELHIACCFDQKMLVGATALISSICRTKSATTRVFFHLFIDEDVEDIALLVEEIAGEDIVVRVREIESALYIDPVNVMLTKASMYRLSIADHVEECVDRILYLDSDTIVLRDLSPLFETNIEDAALAAMPDYAQDAFWSMGHILQYNGHAVELHRYMEGVLGTTLSSYFNTGVMLINLTYWREHSVGAKALGFLRNHPAVFYGDQCALNSIVKDRYKILDARWNSFVFFTDTSYFSTDDASQAWLAVRTAWATDPWIVHFAYKSKPWMPGSIKTPYEHCFWPNLRHTRFGAAREEVSLAGPVAAARMKVDTPVSGTASAALVPVRMQTDLLQERAAQRDLSSQKSLAVRHKGLPTLSFIVVNYNYGCFLKECVESIIFQDYPLLECIVVDNASSDGSAEVIQDLQVDYPFLKVLCRTDNGGQSVACAEGFRQSTGSFIVFVDADDYLLPSFARAHVQAHLTIPHAVGFTSSDMAVLLNDDIVAGSCLEAIFPRHHRFPTIAPARLKDVEQTSRAASRYFAGKCLSLSLVSIDKHVNREWVWAPMTGSMYRRDAIALFVDNEMLSRLPMCTDAYFNLGINAFTGSVLIERSLAVYRIHGRNGFVSKGPLHAMLSHHRSRDLTYLAAYFALQHVMNNFKAFESYSLNVMNLSGSIAVLQRWVSNHPRKHRILKAVMSFLVFNYWKIRGRTLGRLFTQ